MQDRPLRAVVVTSKYDYDTIVRNLTKNYRIPEHKIVAFWKIYQACLPSMVCDRIMQNPKYNDCTGMIIGLCHTEVGIVLPKLKEKFFNLSVSSQDLYFQLQTIRHCMEMYPEKFRKLKYVVLDLYGYNYFNFDTSLSNSALKYLLFGGYHMDSHHFDENRNMGFSFERAMDYLNRKKFEGLTEEQLILYDELFPDILKYTDYEGYDSKFCDLRQRFRVVSDEDVNTYDYGSATRTKIFPETIKENILNFRSILDLLYGLNPEMKIYTVIVPKYIQTQLKEDEVIAKHRLYFNRIISDLQKEYPFEHVDFHMISDIAFEKTNYHDSAHLNYLGALRFTEELNRVIW